MMCVCSVTPLLASGHVTVNDNDTYHVDSCAK
jgi:hypothetical protein